MTYQALYRKYRSQTFDEMVGQEVIATTLKNAIMNGQISHAYLFSGPRGTGKTSAARIFAKAINCLHPENGEPDNTCEICQAINAGSLDDIIELDAASNNGVDEIREIIDKSAYAATRATYKVYIIDEVHMLTTSAFNALLKILEEPTSNVVFILATTELQKVPATIISRVQRFQFKAIRTADIKAHLEDVLADENVTYDEKAIDVIAKSAEGGMRDALSLLDQALSFSDGKLQEKDALLVTGSIADEALVAYVKAISQQDAPSALTELQKIFDEGKNMLRFAEDLMIHFRDLLLSAANEIPQPMLYHWIDIVIDSLKVLRETTQTKIAADVMTMQLAAPVFVSQNLPSAEQAKSVTAATPSQNSQVKPATIEPQRQVQSHFENNNQAPELAPAPEKPVKTPVKKPAVKNYSQDQLFQILEKATRTDKSTIENAWEEMTRSLSSPREAALMKISKVQAVSHDSMILTVSANNLVQLILQNENLINQVNQFLSMIAGFAPEAFVITDEAWLKLRADFVAKRKEVSPLPAADTVSPENSEFPEAPKEMPETMPPFETDMAESPEIAFADDFQAKEKTTATSDPITTAQSLFGDLVNISDD